MTTTMFDRSKTPSSARSLRTTALAKHKDTHTHAHTHTHDKAEAVDNDAYNGGKYERNDGGDDDDRNLLNVKLNAEDTHMAYNKAGHL